MNDMDEAAANILDLSSAPARGPWHRNFDDLRISFRVQFGELIAFHKIFDRAVVPVFDRAAEEASDGLDPEFHDWGDVYADAETALGTGPDELARHLGLMVLIRAVSLAEVTLASVAAKFFTDAQGIVFTNGKAWNRPTAALFFRTMLERPVRIDARGMKPISDLRNLYAHGYGAFPDHASARELEAALFDVIGKHSATPAEQEAGYDGAPFLLGPRSGKHFGMFEFLTPDAHLSQLAVYRLLKAVQATVEDVIGASEWGLKTGEAMATSKFARTWMKRHHEPGAGETELNYFGKVEIQYSGNGVALLDREDDPERLSETMRDGIYDAEVHLTRWRDSESVEFVSPPNG